MRASDLKRCEKCGDVVSQAIREAIELKSYEWIVGCRCDDSGPPVIIYECDLAVTGPADLQGVYFDLRLWKVGTEWPKIELR